MTGRSDLKRPFFLAIAILPLLATGVAANEACMLTPMGTVRVAAVRDGRTLLLDDGRELRLAGIEASDESKSVLQALATGKTLQFGTTGASHDRYGRLFGFAFVDGTRQSLQAALLQQGAARVSTRIGDAACTKALLSAERSAREAGRGLWADPNFAPLQADDVKGISARRGRFGLVEGKVLSVHESGGTLYLNFGRNWTSDFSVIIVRRRARAFASAGMDVNRLKGRHVRVRGWIEQRRGPIIAAETPEQIEILN